MNHGLFPVIKTRLVGVTKNGKDTPEHCCRSELMHSENAPNYIFSGENKARRVNLPLCWY